MASVTLFLFIIVHHLLVICLLTLSLPVYGQWRDKCTGFIVRSRPTYNQQSYQGSALHSIRHTQYRSAIDIGTSLAINNGGPSYSRVNLNAGLKLKLNKNWAIHQDWIIQLHDTSWDTLFHTTNIKPVIGYAGLSIGYEWYSGRPVLGYTYIGLGTGRGKTFTNQDYSLAWFTKSRKGITHNTYLQFQSIWDFNQFFNLYDDNIMMGVGIGWYLDQKSKYKR